MLSRKVTPNLVYPKAAAIGAMMASAAIQRLRIEPSCRRLRCRIASSAGGVSAPSSPASADGSGVPSAPGTAAFVRHAPPCSARTMANAASEQKTRPAVACCSGDDGSVSAAPRRPNPRAKTVAASNTRRLRRFAASGSNGVSASCSSPAANTARHTDSTTTRNMRASMNASRTTRARPALSMSVAATSTSEETASIVAGTAPKPIARSPASASVGLSLGDERFHAASRASSRRRRAHANRTATNSVEGSSH